MKPCPFCGNTNFENELYPSGITWEYNPYLQCKTYSTAGQYENKCWQLNCRCGAEMHGDSKEEVITLWNKRVK